LRREQRRQEYENRNLGNFSRLFPIEDKHEMDLNMNILSTAFNLFYPVGKHLQWRKTYERIKVKNFIFQMLIVYVFKVMLLKLLYFFFFNFIKEDELLDELVECDEEIQKCSKYEQNKMLNEVI
jgi:hypothetical protein